MKLRILPGRNTPNLIALGIFPNVEAATLKQEALHQVNTIRVPCEGRMAALCFSFSFFFASHDGCNGFSSAPACFPVLSFCNTSPLRPPFPRQSRALSASSLPRVPPALEPMTCPWLALRPGPRPLTFPPRGSDIAPGFPRAPRRPYAACTVACASSSRCFLR